MPPASPDSRFLQPDFGPTTHPKEEIRPSFRIARTTLRRERLTGTWAAGILEFVEELMCGQWRKSSC
jgi:hypothetical protein